jgi:hypothetical protein
MDSEWCRRIWVCQLREGSIGEHEWSWWNASKNNASHELAPVRHHPGGSAVSGHPVILTLHWHAFVREKLADVENRLFRSNPSQVQRFSQMRWDDLTTIDRAAMEAGWELGAWDVSCRAAFLCSTGADSAEAIDCLRAFRAFPTACKVR